jgi:hypothetical protein
MTILRRSLAVCLAVLIMAPSAFAQNHVIGKGALDKAVQERVSREQSDRTAIVALLHRPEVRQVATKAGLSLDKAEAGVAMLDGRDLEEIAAKARSVQNDLAGGASTIVISTTTIIVILLLIILIVVIAD